MAQHTQTHTHTHTCRHKHKHTHANTHTYTRTHTPIHTHTHTHKLIFQSLHSYYAAAFSEQLDPDSPQHLVTIVQSPPPTSVLTPGLSGPYSTSPAPSRVCSRVTCPTVWHSWSSASASYVELLTDQWHRWTGDAEEWVELVQLGLHESNVEKVVRTLDVHCDVEINETDRRRETVCWVALETDLDIIPSSGATHGLQSGNASVITTTVYLRPKTTNTITLINTGI